ncbi:MAG TPA: nicotinate phosphoribosyltransferase [Methanosarcina sp.]|nr:nicotinate phosphoribosyltransferase [Methanosarcina sp.]
MKFQDNLIVNTDSYKASHWLQYPDGTETVFSYIESRGGRFDYTVFFGLQMFLKEYLSVPVTREMIGFAQRFFDAHGEPFNRQGWERLVEKHNGYLPLRIRAVPEGTIVPVKNVLVTVENTDPEFFWLTSYVETALLRAVWYPTTVATQSHSIKQVIKKYLEETGDVNGLSFKLHDFGARGVSSFESAAIGGAAHLINFMGSDTVSGVLALSEYYNAPVSGFSIPAAEHSTTTILGKEGEVKQFKRMLDQFAKPGALVAVVSDGYDIYNACQNIWGGTLKKQVQESGATIIIRPDSGDPATVVTKCLELLSDSFGYTVNDKGFKVLNNVRIIQGDGINEQSIRGILMEAKFHGFSADNIAFGMGGALLQQINRDTQKFAMKACAAQINGEWIDVFKDPATDKGKKSKKGRLTAVKNEIGEWETIRTQSVSEEFHVDQMRVVWENGELLVDDTLDAIRARAA